ncbi:MAG TPA: 50S ribosomal protein L31 [Candidatus Megaira endosymbiont of Nemacystus decipiens]|nr:50S ribosomal protein L31 [Candidatus Megaera endosymbiont of Nemacystus decipiens]
MKKGKHPEYGDLEITVGKDKILTKSTLTGKLLMDVDYRKCPAWDKSAVNVVNQSNKNISGFNKKFAGLSFGAKKS